MSHSYLPSLLIAVQGSIFAATPAISDNAPLYSIDVGNSETCRQVSVRDQDSKAVVPLGCVLKGGVGFSSSPAILAVDGISPLDTSLSNRGRTHHEAYKNPNVVRIGAGNMVSFCPSLSCLSGDGDSAPTNDHHRTSLLVSSRMQDDAHSQEQSLAVITTIDKGQTKPWKPSAPYKAGDNLVNAGQVYRALANCRSATDGKGPSGMKTSGIADGTCSWGWINASGINAKVGSYFETKVMPGAGSAWGAAFNYHINMDVDTPNAFFPGVEFDYANNSGKDCRLGVTDCTSIRVGIAGNGSITHGMQITGDGFDRAGVRHKSMLWGLRINGEHSAQESSIEIDTQSKVGLGFGTSGIGDNRHSIATIKDQTTSPTSIDIGGSHVTGINLTGKFSSFQIAGNNFILYPDGSARLSNSNASTSSVTGALQIPSGGLGVGGNGFFGGQVTAGSVSVGSGLLHEVSAPPASSSSPCVAGTRTWDKNYEYRCVATNTWRRSALSSW